MAAELIKRNDGWDLYKEDGHKIASTLDGYVNKLSLKNCQAIERGYDLDELAEKFMIDESYGQADSSLWKGYLFGFQKALSILGDKKFSEEDMNNAIELAQRAILDSSKIGTSTHTIKEIIQSLQQTEWEVEVIMEDSTVQFSPSATCIQDSDYIVVTSTLKLDADGFLILKRV